MRYFIASRQAEHQYDQLARQVHQAEKDTETGKNGISENKVLPQYQKLLKQNPDLVTMNDICIVRLTEQKAHTGVSLPMHPAAW